MKLINTSHFSDELVRDVVNFARPSGVRNFTINVRKGSHRFSGHCSYSDRYISLTIGKQNHNQCSYPVFIKHTGESKQVMIKGKQHTFSKQKGYLDYLLLSDIESLVQVAAHEMFHLKQHDDPRCHKVWGSRGKQSERACDAFGIRKTREWRKAHSVEVNVSEYLDLFNSNTWGDGKHYQCIDCKQMFQREELAIIRTGGFNKKKPITFSGLCEKCFIPRFTLKGSFYTHPRNDNWTSSTMTKVGQKYWKEIEQIDRKLYPHNFKEENQVTSTRKVVNK